VPLIGLCLSRMAQTRLGGTGCQGHSGNTMYLNCVGFVDASSEREGGTLCMHVVV